MIARALALALPLVLFAAAPPAVAQAPAPVSEPESASPDPVARQKARLDKLFADLRVAADAKAATALAQQIERLLERSGSDTADLMLTRAKQAIEAKDYPQALDLLDFAITLRPDWAEAYHRRAVVHFLMKDEEASIRDVHAALAREPRHYHALAGLGGIYRGMGNRKLAFRAFEAAHALHPFFGDLKETLEKMRVEIGGQPI